MNKMLKFLFVVTFLVLVFAIGSVIVTYAEEVTIIDNNFDDGNVPSGALWGKKYDGTDSTSISNVSGVMKLTRTSSTVGYYPVLMYKMPYDISKGKLTLTAKIKSLNGTTGGLGFSTDSNVNTTAFLSNIWAGTATNKRWQTSNGTVFTPNNGAVNIYYNVEVVCDLSTGIQTTKLFDLNGNQVGQTSNYSFGSTLIKSLKFYLSTPDILYIDNVLLKYEFSDTVINDSIFVNVVKLGADNTGVNDATAIIQGAIDSASNANKTIFFPSGTYKITAPIVLKSRTSLLGVPADNDYGGSVIVAGQDMDSMLTSANRTPTTKEILIDTCSIENLTFNAKKDSNISVDWVFDMGISSCRFFNLKLYNVSGGGITTDITKNGTLETDLENRLIKTWMVHVEKVRVEAGDTNKYAVEFYCSDSQVDGLSVSGGKGYIVKNNGGNVYVNCIFENSVDNGFNIDNFAGNIAISNSVFRNNTNSGLYVNSIELSSANLMVGNSFSKNEFIGNGETDIKLNNANNISIANNSFKSTNLSSGQNIISSGENNSFRSSGSIMANVVYNNKFSCSSYNIPYFTFWGNTFGVTSNWGDTGIINVISEQTYKDLYKNISRCSPNTVNVKDYGAIGNGTADDALSIQNAIDSVPTGGYIYVPAGNYLVKTPIIIKSNITVFGDGFGSSYIIGGEDMDSVIKTNTTTANVIFSHIYIKVNSGKQVDNTMYLDNLTNSKFYNVVIKNDTHDAIYVGSNSSNIIFKNILASVVESTDTQGAILILEGTNCVVQNSYISDSKNGIVFRGIGGHTVYNCHIDIAKDAAVRFENAVQSMSDNNLFNLYFDHNYRVMAFNYTAMSNTNHIKIENFIMRRSEVIGRDKVPEVYVDNARHVDFINGAIEMERDEYSTEYNFQFVNSDYINLTANTGPFLYDEHNSGFIGSNSVLTANYMRLVDKHFSDNIVPNEIGWDYYTDSIYSNITTQNNMLKISRIAEGGQIYQPIMIYKLPHSVSTGKLILRAKIKSANGISGSIGFSTNQTTNTTTGYYYNLFVTTNTLGEKVWRIGSTDMTNNVSGNEYKVEMLLDFDNNKMTTKIWSSTGDLLKSVDCTSNFPSEIQSIKFMTTRLVDNLFLDDIYLEVAEQLQ